MTATGKVAAMVDIPNRLDISGDDFSTGILYGGKIAGDSGHLESATDAGNLADWKAAGFRRQVADENGHHMAILD